jgi:hypothetical protein
MQQAYGEPVPVRLSELVELSEVLPDDTLAVCTRPINDAHLADLRAIGVEHLPPMKVANLEGRRILVGGYHRLELWLEQNAVTVPVQIIQAQGLNDVVMLAYEDNAQHGLEWARGTKTAYALWLYHQAEAHLGPDEKPNLSAIARLAGLDKSVLSRALKKEQAPASAVCAESNGYERPATVSATDKLLKALIGFYAAEANFWNRERGPANIEKRAMALAKGVWQRSPDSQEPARLRSLAKSIMLAADKVEHWQQAQAQKQTA